MLSVVGVDRLDALDSTVVRFGVGQGAQVEPVVVVVVDLQAHAETRAGSGQDQVQLAHCGLLSSCRDTVTACPSKPQAWAKAPGLLRSSGLGCNSAQRHGLSLWLRREHWRALDCEPTATEGSTRLRWTTAAR